MIRRTAYQRQLPLVELQLLAHCELAVNPTISTYKFVDGVEVRRPANPWEVIQTVLDQTYEALCSILGFDWDSMKTVLDGIADSVSPEVDS